jgi:hypothetical protein
VLLCKGGIIQCYKCWTKDFLKCKDSHQVNVGVEFPKPIVEFYTNWYLPQFEHLYFDSSLLVAKIIEE